MRVITAERIVCAALVVFLLVGLFIVDDYGMNTDSQKNYQEGAMNLDYLLTRHVDRDILQWQMHGAYIFVLADAAKRILHDRLGLYDATPARHVIIPVMMAAFLAMLFFFVRRHWSALHGLAAVGVLLTFPYVWGQTFNNLKDVPLLIFFSLSVMSFVEWISTRALKYLYGFFIMWGLAIAVKTYAFFVLPLLGIWILVRPETWKRGTGLPRPRTLAHAAIGLCVTAVIVAALYAPAFWGIGDKLVFLGTWREHVKAITYAGRSPFNLNPFVQVLFRTPLLVLVCVLAGLLAAARKYRASPMHSLLFVWVTLPLAIPCFPRTLVYHNGMRLFMVFLVPFSVLAAIGIGELAGGLAKRLKKSREALFAAIASITVGASLWGVVSTHPYETTFFNALAGGLKGAQEKRIADSWDYWLNSYREAERWLDRSAVPNANVVAMYRSGTAPRFHTELMKDAITRADLAVLRLPAVPARAGRVAIPGNTYVIMVPFDYLRPSREFLERSKEFRKVYEIRRQGGEICTIFYKPPSR